MCTLNLQCALVVLNASKQLAKVALAKAPTASRLLNLLLPIWLFHCVLTAYPLNDL